MTNSKIYQPASCGILRFYFILKKAIQERLINTMLARVIYFSKSIEVTFDKVWFNARTKYCITDCNASEFRRASRTTPPPPQEDYCLYTCHLPGDNASL